MSFVQYVFITKKKSQNQLPSSRFCAQCYFLFSGNGFAIRFWLGLCEVVRHFETRRAPYHFHKFPVTQNHTRLTLLIYGCRVATVIFKKEQSNDHICSNLIEHQNDVDLTLAMIFQHWLVRPRYFCIRSPCSLFIWIPEISSSTRRQTTFVQTFYCNFWRRTLFLVLRARWLLTI